MNLKKMFHYTMKDKALLLIFWGFFAFFIGFHNMDQGQNLMRLELMMGMENQTLVETNGLGWQMTLPDTYRIGCILVLFSVILLFMGGYAYGQLKNPD